MANLPQRAPSGQGPMNIVKQPNLYPRTCVTRIVNDLFVIINDGINPTLEAFIFTLSQLPGVGEFTKIFQSYCIEQIEFWIRPEYTQLVDSATLSNAKNVELYTAVDLTNNSAPPSVDSLLEYQSVAHTNITTNHYRKFKPSYMLGGVAPSCNLISCDNPDERWNCLKVAIPPCGVAMTFRTVVKYKVALS